MVLSQKGKPLLGSSQTLQGVGKNPKPRPPLSESMLWARATTAPSATHGLHHWGFHPFAAMLAALIWAHPPGNLPRLIKFSQLRQALSWGHCHPINPQQPPVIISLPSLDFSTWDQASVLPGPEAGPAGPEQDRGLEMFPR